MIRIQSLQFGADNAKVPMMLQLGWFDPDLKLSRAKMTGMAMDALKAFQTHMRLKGGTFDVEYMANFCAKREALGPELCRVIIFDGAGGVGAEWNKDPLFRHDPTQYVVGDFDITEFTERIKTYMDDQLVKVRDLATLNDHQDVVDAVTAELERRKV